MPSPRPDDDCTSEIVDYPRWVLLTTHALHKAQVEGPVAADLIGLAALWLLACECDAVKPPMVTRTHEGNVRLTWNGEEGRGAAAEIRPKRRLYLTRWNDTEILSQTVFHRDQFDALRDMLAWLYPAVHTVEVTTDIL